MIVYIAGPFRAPTAWGVELHVRAAESVALEVARLGHVPLCPHAMYRHYDGSLPDEYWLRATLTLLQRCDAILMLPDWEGSHGSRLEWEYARAHEIPDHYSLATLGIWAEVRTC